MTAHDRSIACDTVVHDHTNTMTSTSSHVIVSAMQVLGGNSTLSLPESTLVAIDNTAAALAVKSRNG